ncbi:hypothetical protein [Asticcacaulis sp. 201]|uniref:hypothetical protein n=1 Tax=Asticcacaulis sp. 201 TaxID=3028787 RepID=UPI0029166D89|nr:hypothetical protein [Asticcacaulis sp. 201]MDV6329901.1 hypothetical protein [Asticcacaulis sp. 201]
MRVYFWILCLMLAAAPRPSAAQSAEPSHHVTCAGRHAAWQSGFDPQPGADLSGKIISLPPGTQTHIFTCRVGAHMVVMKYANMGSPQYHCGGTTDGWINVWVDGTPVVTRRQWGDYDNCMGGEDEANAHIVNRILINNRLRITLCEQIAEYSRDKPFAPSERVPGQTVRMVTSGGKTTYIRSTAQHCVLTPITIDPRAAPVRMKRTPPGLRLALSRAPVCTAIGRHLVYFPDARGRDRSLWAYRFRPVEDYVPSPRDLGQDGGLGEKVFSLDIDNDGVPDHLIRHIFVSDTVPNQYSWISGKTGKRHDITGKGLDDSQFYAMPGNWPNPVLSTLHFIRWHGQTYLYVTMVDQQDALPGTLAAYERGVGAASGTAFSGRGISRRIFAIKSDGSAVNLCNWTPRKRPEEFL